MIGKSLSHYRILDKLGEGGMGAVYLAQDTKLKRKIALKVLPSETASENIRLARFQREAEAVAALNHPNIVHIYSVEQAGGVHFLTMELVEGTSLDRVIEGGGFDLKMFFEIAAPLADALAAAHAKGITHRDLKPANVMIADEGRRVKILDFGLAKLATVPGDDLDASQITTLAMTQDGTVLGTVPYMSPEQVEGKPLDHRTDIFSLGVVLYEMVTGKRPFRGDNQARLMSSILTHAPAPVTEVREELPRHLGRIIDRCLEKDLDRRYQSAKEVRNELESLQKEVESGAVLDTGRPPVAEAPAQGKGRRGRWVIGSGVVGLVALVAAFLTIPSLRDLGLQRPVGQLDQPAARADALDDLTPSELVQRGQAGLLHLDQPELLDGAIEDFERSLVVQPQSAPAHAGLAEAYLEKYKVHNPDAAWLQRARERAEDSRRLDSHLAAAHTILGRVLVQTGDLEQAGNSLERARGLSPLDAAVHRALGELSNALDDPEAAEAHLTRAIELAPDDWRPRSDLSVVQFQRARYKDAEATVQRWLELAPNNVYGYQTLAAILHYQGRLDEAALALQDALQIRPEANVYSNLGTILFYQGRYVDAAEAYERAVELKPNHRLFWFNLGDAYRWVPGREGDASDAYLRAIQLLDEALERQPDDPLLLSELAECQAKRDDREDALATLARLEGVAGDDPEVWFSALKAYEIAGDREKALAALPRALDSGYPLDSIRTEPELIELRKDVRFHRLLLHRETEPTD